MSLHLSEPYDGDPLRQAKHLYLYSYFRASAMLTRLAIEQHLLARCRECDHWRAGGCTTKSANFCARFLWDAGRIPDIVEHVEGTMQIANGAAHGRTVRRPDVQRVFDLYDEVVNLLP